MKFTVLKVYSQLLILSIRAEARVEFSQWPAAIGPVCWQVLIHRLLIHYVWYMVIHYNIALSYRALTLVHNDIYVNITLTT